MCRVSAAADDAQTQSTRTLRLLFEELFAGTAKYFRGAAPDPALRAFAIRRPCRRTRGYRPRDGSRAPMPVLHDEFNCRSRGSDSRSKCAELEFLITTDHALERAFKVPSLRNVAERAP